MKKAALGLMMAILSPAIAQADWQGQFNIRVTQSSPGARQFPESTGAVKMKKNMLRMDMKTPIDMSFIIDLEKQTSLSLVHGQKLILKDEIPKEDLQLPLCSTDRVDECYKKLGLKAIGKETLDGEPCSILEGVVKQKKSELKMKIWRPDRLKEVPALKSISDDQAGRVIEAHFTQVKQTSLPGSDFKAPANYRSMGSIQDFVNQLKSH